MYIKSICLPVAVNPLPYHKIFTCFVNFLAVRQQFLFDMVENIVEIGENAGCQHFLL